MTDTVAHSHPAFSRRAGWLAAVLVVLGWSIAFIVLRSVPQPAVILHMHVYADHAGAVQWYYDRGQGLSESEMVSADVRRGDNQITFQFPTGVYRFLRFDPINNDSHTRIDHLQWEALPGVTTPPNADELQPLANIDRVERHGGSLDIWPVTNSPDPQMSLPLAAPLDWSASMQSPATDALRALIAAIVLVATTFIVWRYLTMFRLVVTGMSIASILIFAMAWVSTTKASVHPDEYSHYFAYQYYETHLLPPAIVDPATIPSTSVWGFSYLFELDVVYDIAAQATIGLRHWLGDDLFAARMFQFAMWLILLAMAALRRSWTWVLCVTLITPQLWYVFSYLNADAFPFFLSIVAACLIADESSGLNRFLREGGMRRAALWIAALCLGGVLVSKRNYLPIVPVFLIWLAVIHLRVGATIAVIVLGALLMVGVSVFVADVPSISPIAMPLKVVAVLLAGVCVVIIFLTRWRDSLSRGVLLRLVGFTTLCIAVAAPRVAWDVHVNGMPAQKNATIHQVIEQRAGVDFKPSAIAAGKGNPSVGLASRGVSLSQLIFAPYNWGWSSMASAFGIYGYMSIFTPNWMYLAFATLAFALTLLAVNALRRECPNDWIGLTSVFVVGALLVISSSLLLSWTNALQSQGRYLLPILPMFALVLGVASPQIPSLTTRLIGSAALSLGVVSFVGYALPAFVGQ